MKKSFAPLEWHWKAIIRALANIEAASNHWQIFIYLQCLDFLTTVVGFRLGLSEASPFLRALMHAGPVAAILFSKILALGIAGLCVALNRGVMIRRINYWYAALVIWNLCVILLAHGPR